MIDRPLTEQEELVGDQIASIFYQSSPGPIITQIQTLLSNQPLEVVENITSATLSRLYSEQAARRDFLITAFNLQTTSQSEQVTQLLALSESAVLTDVSQEALDQLGYFKTVSTNLLSYETEQWEKENNSLFRIIVQLSPQVFDGLSQSLASYNAAFYQNHAFEHISQVSIPPSVIESLKNAGIAVELSHYESLIQKSTFLAFLQQSCQLITGLRDQGITDESETIRALSIATLRFRDILTRLS